jgi:hypothetical protein
MKKHKPDEQNIISFIGASNYTYGGVSIYAKTFKKMN